MIQEAIQLQMDNLPERELSEISELNQHVNDVLSKHCRSFTQAVHILRDAADECAQAICKLDSYGHTTVAHEESMQKFLHDSFAFAILKVIRDNKDYSSREPIGNPIEIYSQPLSLFHKEIRYMFEDNGYRMIKYKLPAC